MPHPPLPRESWPPAVARRAPALARQAPPLAPPLALPALSIRPPPPSIACPRAKNASEREIPARWHTATIQQKGGLPTREKAGRSVEITTGRTTDVLCDLWTWQLPYIVFSGVRVQPQPLPIQDQRAEEIDNCDQAQRRRNQRNQFDVVLRPSDESRTEARNP